MCFIAFWMVDSLEHSWDGLQPPTRIDGEWIEHEYSRPAHVCHLSRLHVCVCVCNCVRSHNYHYETTHSTTTAAPILTAVAAPLLLPASYDAWGLPAYLVGWLVGAIHHLWSTIRSADDRSVDPLEDSGEEWPKKAFGEPIRGWCLWPIQHVCVNQLNQPGWQWLTISPSMVMTGYEWVDPG